jgi:plastocyanin
MRFLKAAATLAGLFLFTSAAQARIDTVRMVDYAFVPATIVISPGDTIVWKSTQQCCEEHTTTRSFGTMTWDAAVPLNSTYQLTFNQVGTFNYGCTSHFGLGMAGSIIVFNPAPTLGWAGLLLLLASLAAAGIWMLERRRKTA